VLIKRGKLKKYFYADICVFDSQKIKNNSDLKILNFTPQVLKIFW
tara:strand:+ start:370 stop:504 length:135 start_codon:yes stop_codon:yes gene_type:complete